MSDCLFCKIARKEIPAEIIYEDEKAVGFLDVQPLAPGHTVIVPKNHAENIIELTDGDVGPLFLAVKKITAMLDKAFKPDGFIIGINHGRFSGHTTGVDHLHIHVYPRWHSDKGISIHDLVHNPVRESLSEIAKKIKIANNL